MKKILFIALAAIAVLSGCAKDDAIIKEQISNGDANGLVFTATIEQGASTRTTLETTAGENYGKVYWESGDQISINGVNYTATPDGGDATKASFAKVSGAEPSATFYAYYPATIYNGGTPTLPAIQSYVAGTISNNPMYATSEDANLAFKNLCGLLAVKVTNADIATLKSIRVSSSNHDMSGAFTVTDNAAVLSSDAGGTNMVELVSAEALTLTAEGTIFYIAIPANTYRDLLIELSSDGTYYSLSMVTKAATDIVVDRNKVYKIDFADNNYLCFTANGSITIALNKKGSPATNSVEYSTDKSNWAPYTYDVGIDLTDGQKLYFRAEGNRGSEQSTSKYVYFSITSESEETAEVSGNVMYLLNTAPGVSMYNRYDCINLFKDCKKLTKADKLVLPATTLAMNCYSNMFYGCTGLTSAPALPATTLASSCYQQMFYGCTGLTSAPALPATTLVSKCYLHMFNGCIGLTSAPALPATTLANNCYSNMFNGCTGLTSAPALPATNLADYCYQYMFSGCTNLKTAPALPATTLANNCYQYMFSGCTNLTTAPALPATTLVFYCYRYMFKNCENLTSITCLATNIEAEKCTENWVEGVSATGTFYRASTSNWGDKGTNGIPTGWTDIPL